MVVERLALQLRLQTREAAGNSSGGGLWVEAFEPAHEQRRACS